MLGAIVGDIIGSVYEFKPIRTTRFPLFGQGNHFTDETLLTIAVAEAYYGRVPHLIAVEALRLLPAVFVKVLVSFHQRHPLPLPPTFARSGAYHDPVLEP